jgi:hypothetical protein
LYISSAKPYVQGKVYGINCSTNFILTKQCQLQRLLIREQTTQMLTNQQ